MDAVPAPSPHRRPLRILVVSNLYPSSRNPSFGTFVGARVAELRHRGHHVAVAAILHDRAHERVGRKYAGLAIGALRAAVSSRARGRPYDMVEAHIAFPTGLVGWLAARIGGGRLVLFCHGSDVIRLPWSSPRRAAIARWLFARADLVVANSRYTADIAATRLGPLRREVAVVSPGISLPTMSAEAQRRDAMSILFVGRLAAGKGVEVLIAAMEHLVGAERDATLTIVGDGPLREALEGQRDAAGLDERVRFVGALPPDAVRKRYASSGVVAVPSTEPEGLNLVALEAMAAGAIVVGTTVGGLAETIQDGENGFVIRADDPADLAAGLSRALAIAASPEGDRLRSRGRATAAAHDLANAVSETVRRYRELIDG